MPWFSIFLIGLGVLLLFIEIVLLPGFGAGGIPGIALIVVGLWLIWHKFGLKTGLVYAGVTVAFTIPIAILGLWLAPRTKLWKSLTLHTTVSRAEGFQAPPQELINLVGKSGKAVTSLRPAGVALINGQRVDVVTLGDFVEPQTAVEVILVEGNRVVVRSL